MIKFCRFGYSSLHRQCSRRHCVSFVLLSLTIFSIICVLSIQLPLSPFYKKFHDMDKTLKLANDKNTDRLERAISYWKNMKQSQTSYKKTALARPDLVVSIVTAGRNEKRHRTGYLIQTAAVVNRLVQFETNFKNIVFFVCNVDEFPAAHSDAVFLQGFIPYVQKFGTNSFNKSFSSKHFKASHLEMVRGKEVEDYVFCVNFANSFNSSYVLMLEDDVLPYGNMFEVLHYTLKNRFGVSLNRESDVDEGRQFSLLKLYYPERWQGYAFEMIRVMELVSIGLIGGAVVLVLSIVFAKGRCSYLLHAFYFVFGVAFTMVSVSVIGRQGVMALRQISPQLYKFGPTPKCCTPAMFYASTILANMTKFLMEHSSINKDIAIHKYVDTISIPGYQLEPNLVRHIGMYTSLQHAYKPPEEFVFDIPLEFT